ncbi:MAG: Nitroreductase [Methanomicrobiales archaeon 53_19]|nr:MAG: Nitroreductase [Methanomicrobiales archaeon 53_19]
MYNITGYDGAAYFDAYAWNNQSNQGQGVSWTNKVIGTGSSGWAI